MEVMAVGMEAVAVAIMRAAALVAVVGQAAVGPARAE